MADHGLDQSVYVARPHRVRVITIIATLALCLLTAMLIVGMLALASSYVRADPDGLRIRNGLRVHAVPWGRVHKIILRSGDPWALLLITPGDGRPFEADVDAEKRQLMGIQAVDGPLAKAAVNELRVRHRRFLETH